jgi:arabinoxylan arabinofuranohydrolase
MNKYIHKSFFILAVFAFVLLFTTCLIFNNRQNIAAGDVKLYKTITDHNPIMTHTFGADPSALVYNGRVYIYMTGDTLDYDENGIVKQNNYRNIDTIRVVSSADMANWTYHEPVKAAGLDEGAAEWARLSWAPAAVYKQIGGKDKFFLYFSNNANGIGVLTADSPLGPWVDPLGRALVTRQTPNCSDIPWLFDPAVFIDDDGKGYLYFGGGIPQGREANPGSARVVPLGDDMVSLAGVPARIDAPFFFEDSGINKINGKYFYSYCTNWNVTESAKREFGIDNAVIAVMSSNSPMGPFAHEGTILRNPGSFFGCWGNNHHSIFEFNGRWYIAYHSQVLEEAMGIHSKGYRVTHVDAVTVSSGKFQPVTGTRRGAPQIGRLNPYVWHKGAESGVSAGLSFGSVQLADSSEPLEYAVILRNGSWLGVYGADFGETGAKNITIYAGAGQRNSRCTAEIRIGSPAGEIAGTLTAALGTSFTNYTVNLIKTVSGVHDVYFVFSGAFNFGGWQFSNE